LNTNPARLTKKAFAYPLKRSNYNFSKASTDTGKPSGDDDDEYVPNVPTNSKILDYDDFARIWKLLPDYVKIRVPELIFCTQTDGYNIKNLYRVSSEFKNEYKFSLIICQSTSGKIFGAFVDEVLR
jgi:hypothetical protein